MKTKNDRSYNKTVMLTMNVDHDSQLGKALLKAYNRQELIFSFYNEDANLMVLNCVDLEACKSKVLKDFEKELAKQDFGDFALIQL